MSTNFERKIASEKLKEQELTNFEPSKAGSGGTVVVNGGPVREDDVKDVWWKDWGHTINQHFEMRSHSSTLRYIKLLAADIANDEISVKINPSDFAHHLVRCPVSSNPLKVNIVFEKPQGVPSDQKRELTPAEEADPEIVGYRHRVWTSFVEFYHPSSDQSIYPDSNFIPVKTYRDEAASAPLYDDPPLDPPRDHYHDNGFSMWIDLEGSPYVVGENGTATLFMIQYNERYGKALITPLARGVEIPDPLNPDQGSTEENDATADDDENTESDKNPWDDDPEAPAPGEPPSSLVPSEPGDVTDYPYGGMTVTKPTLSIGDVFALHEDGISFSTNGGMTWAFKDLSDPRFGTLVDFAVSKRYGLWLLNSDGEVFWRSPSGAMVTLDYSDNFAPGDIEVTDQITNGDFETGDLTGWTLLDGDEPRVLQTQQPPQMPGSTYYLTRDWAIISPQDFKIAQNVTLAAEQQNVRLAVDYFSRNNDVAKISLRNFAKRLATPNGTNSFSGNTCADFATSPSGELLDLVSLNGQTAGIDGVSSGSNLFYRLQLRYKNGTPYDGPWFMPMGNLNPNSEWMDVDNNLFIDYIIAPGDSAATPAPAGEPNRTRFYSNNGGILDMGLVVGQSTIEFDLRTLGGAFDITQDLTNDGYYGSNVASAQSTGNTINNWKTLEIDLDDVGGGEVELVLEAKAVNGYGDVWFDNVRLTSIQVGAEPVPTPSAIAAGQLGPDVYIGDMHIYDGPEQEIFTPGFENVYAAENHNLYRIAADTQGAWFQSDTVEWSLFASGSISDVVAGPLTAAIDFDGTLYLADRVSGGGLSDHGAGAGHKISGDFLRDGILHTHSTDGTTKLFKKSDFSFAAYAQQPVEAAADERRSICLDIGRYIGYNIGNRDIYWTDTPQTEWKLGGSLYKPILKMVEVRDNLNITR